jgi:hypothetical protein
MSLSKGSSLWRLRVCARDSRCESCFSYDVTVHKPWGIVYYIGRKEYLLAGIEVLVCDCIVKVPCM